MTLDELLIAVTATGPYRMISGRPWVVCPARGSRWPWHQSPVVATCYRFFSPAELFCGEDWCARRMAISDEDMIKLRECQVTRIRLLRACGILPSAATSP